MEPFVVIIWDPVAHKRKKTVVLTGNPPSDIAHALSNVKSTKHKFSQSDVSKLRGYYGANWKMIIGVDADLPYKQGGSVINDVTDDVANESVGAGTSVDGDLENIEFSDEDWNILKGDESDKMDKIGPVGETNAKKSKEADVQRTTKKDEIETINISDVGNLTVNYVNDYEAFKIAVYPDDKINDLRDKITLATNIPYYRQHVFAYEHRNVITFYKLYADGIYKVNINEISNTKNKILDIGVDKLLYEYNQNADDIKVEPYDQFTLVSTLTSRVIFVVDLNDMIRNRQALLNLIGDNYNFDLLYGGFVVKYYPHFSKEIFKYFLQSEEELYEKFPDLAKNITSLKRRYTYEAKLCDDLYKNASSVNKWYTSLKDNSNITMSITKIAITTNSPRPNVNIRNLFDMFTVTNEHPEARAVLDHEGSTYYVRKTYITDENSVVFPASLKSGFIVALSVNKKYQETFHKIHKMSSIEAEMINYIYLNILENGSYVAYASWNIEDEYGFYEAIKTVRKHVDPIIADINKMGHAVFINGGQLEPISQQNIEFVSINIALTWKKNITEAGFKAFKNMFTDYISAGIFKHHGFPQNNMFELRIIKGMYDYDIDTISRSITYGTQYTFNNLYAYMSNNLVKQKWDLLYSGRVIRFSHRTSDILIEISNMHEAEFETAKLYITDILRKFASEYKSAPTEASVSGVKKLRRLKEIDPDLFNLKKFGSDKVYSVICQNPNQPVVYSKDEYDALSAATKKVVTQYWNFTMGKPAYYGCPTSKYPHLSFKTGFHPKHYCLPCCDKGAAVEESNKSKIRSVCLSDKHTYNTSTGDTQTSSRYIINYGKNVEPGRISHIPGGDFADLIKSTLKKSSNHDLFEKSDAVNNKDLVDAKTQYVTEKMNKNVMNEYVTTHRDKTDLDYYIYGVQQSHMSLSDIGSVFSFAMIHGMSLAEYIRDIIFKLKSSRHIWQVLLKGRLQVNFGTMDRFIDTLIDNFVKNNVLSSKENVFTDWNTLFIELELFLNGLHTVIISDQRDVETVNRKREFGSKLIYKRSLVDAPTTPTPDFTNVKKNEIELYIHDTVKTYISQRENSNIQVAILMHKGVNYYPFVMLSADDYFDSLDAYVNVKSSAKNNVKELNIYKTFFTSKDNIVRLIYNMIHSVDLKFNYTNIENIYNLDILNNFIAVNPKYVITEMFINKSNSCYAVFVTVDSHKLYVPIDYSTYTNEFSDINLSVKSNDKSNEKSNEKSNDKNPKIKLNFDVIDDNVKASAPYSVLKNFITEFNKYVETNFTVISSGYQSDKTKILQRYYFSKIEIKSFIEPFDSTTINSFKSTSNLKYYFTELDATVVKQYPVEKQKYNMSEINRIILSNAPPKLPENYNRIGNFLYKNYIYQLILYEFINWTQRERNVELRRQLRRLIENYNFNKDVNDFITKYKKITQVMSEEDVVLLGKQLYKFNYIEVNKKEFLEDIESTRYAFDNMTLNKLVKLKSKVEIIKELRKIMPEFTTVGNLNLNSGYIEFNNIFTPCKVHGKSHASYCSDKKLVIDSSLNYDDLIDLFAGDLMNETRVKILSSGLLGLTTSDYFKFTKHPDEIIKITK